jgi:hypothetical protein
MVSAAHSDAVWYAKQLAVQPGFEDVESHVHDGSPLHGDSAVYRYLQRSMQYVPFADGWHMGEYWHTIMSVMTEHRVLHSAASGFHTQSSKTLQA